MSAAISTLSTPGVKKAQIVVVFPVGIPGMGKTHFAETILGESFDQMGLSKAKNLKIIQNDLVRKQCLDQWVKQNPNKSISEGVKATGHMATNVFKDQLNNTLTKMSQSKNSDLQVIYLDKNYPPAEIKITIEAINEHAANASASIRKVALVPHIAKNNYCADYPFSTSFLLQCYIRCLERGGHLTISNEDPKRLIKILILFFQQFMNI